MKDDMNTPEFRLTWLPSSAASGCTSMDLPLSAVPLPTPCLPQSVPRPCWCHRLRIPAWLLRVAPPVTPEHLQQRCYIWKVRGACSPIDRGTPEANMWWSMVVALAGYSGFIDKVSIGERCQWCPVDGLWKGKVSKAFQLVIINQFEKKLLYAIQKKLNVWKLYSCVQYS